MKKSFILAFNRPTLLLHCFQLYPLSLLIIYPCSQPSNHPIFCFQPSKHPISLFPTIQPFFILAPNNSAILLSLLPTIITSFILAPNYPTILYPCSRCRISLPPPHPLYLITILLKSSFFLSLFPLFSFNS